MITEDHNWIIDYAFGPKGPTGPEFYLSELDRFTLKRASGDADAWLAGHGGQTRAGSYKHSMCGEGQSKDAATELRDKWVDECLRLAGALERNRNHIDALYRLGLGMHTIADSFSPQHEGCQEWAGLELDEPRGWPSDLSHRIHEQYPSTKININRFRDMHERKADAAMALRRYYRAFKSLSRR